MADPGGGAGADPGLFAGGVNDGRVQPVASRGGGASAPGPGPVVGARSKLFFLTGPSGGSGGGGDITPPPLELVPILKTYGKCA